MKFFDRITIVLVIIVAVLAAGCSHKRPGHPRVLVFTKTMGFHHASIPDGAKAIMKLGDENGFDVDTTSDASKFTEDTLKQYSAVVFMSTTGDVLDNYQQADFERYIQAGGGYVGVHAAADCEYHWPWYGKLVGAWFKSHPMQQEATLRIHKDKNFPVTDSLPDPWKRKDEWYNFRALPQDVHVLVSIDESSYEGGQNGADHPMVWYHDYDGGRAFYTELGHTSESYTEPNFLKLLLAGIQYAIGDNQELNYNKATALRVPSEERFSKQFLAGGLDEPTEIAVLPDLSVLIAERKGDIKFYNQQDKTIAVVAHLNVYDKTTVSRVNVETGLLGLQKDPDYDKNHWIYAYYSPIDKSVDRLSRFKFEQNKFNLQSEQIILEVPTERDMCCHTGGSIAFDKEGNLYVSVGDNTTPFDEPDSTTGKSYPINLHGYAPLDDRPGFSHYDDRRAAGNSNDLRGKILRIKVHEDGSYEVPVGNLFPKGTAKSKPEIYVMGDRNPYRISVDQHTGFLYWGEVGPDASNDSLETRGPRGYDEVNQARKAGNFGWPYFVGNNYAYHEYDYATGTPGPAFDPQHVVNNSRNNTGLKDLPPAQPAFIWYPYAESPDFPILKTGGRTAMAGPVYYTADYPESTRYPEYYNGKLFIYDWIRNWIMLVTMNKEGDLQTIEPFMPHTKFHNISDMEAGKDGKLYIVEYGEGWFTKNPNAELSVLDYNPGDIAPKVSFSTDVIAGPLPLTIHLSAKGSYDPDGDPLSYEWNIGNNNKQQTTAPDTAVTITKAGEYLLSVAVSDGKGATTRSPQIKVYAGNTIPKVSVNISGNHSFYFPGEPINYQVTVNDNEDGSSDSSGFDLGNILVKADYTEGLDKAAIPNEQDLLAKAGGKSLMESLDCKSCHKIDEKSIGPAFRMVAAKYKNDAKTMDYLTHKIINGGSGVWGETAMSAHPSLSEQDARQIVSWVLSLADHDSTGKQVASLPVSGSIRPEKYSLTDKGVFLITASYTDKGANGISPLTGTDAIVLGNPYIPALGLKAEAKLTNLRINGISVKVLNGNEGWLALPSADLTGIKTIAINYGVREETREGYQIEAHLDTTSGQLLGSATIGKNMKPNTLATAMIRISPVNDGKSHSIYWVISKKNPAENTAIGITGFRLMTR